MNGIVIAGSGPSLKKIGDIRAAGLPVAAVSTAIRCIPKPDYWLICDLPNAHHGPEGQAAVKDESVHIVIPDRFGLGKRRNVTVVPYSRNRKLDAGRRLGDGKLPLLRGSHYSITFAIQWFYYTGFDPIILAGVDLVASREHGGYAYQRSLTTATLAHLKLLCGKVLGDIKEFAIRAAAEDRQILDWSPGGKLSQFLVPFTPDGEATVPREGDPHCSLDQQLLQENDRCLSTKSESASPR